LKADKLIEQLDLYSNAIVGFMVAQSIAFSFTFGTNAQFGCEITRYKLLAAALITHFIFSTALCSWALVAIARRMCMLSAETEKPLSTLGLSTLRTAAKAKAAVTFLFALIPVGLLIFFGLLTAPDSGRCVKQVKTAWSTHSAAQPLAQHPATAGAVSLA
jgi:hypothetical protein